jgi:hypothetical protein
MSIISTVPLRTIETSMALRVLSGILIILLVAESGYIALNRHSVNRFKPVDQDGYLAFDSATGQLCKSYRSKAPEKTAKPAPTSSPTPQSQSLSEDRILSAIGRGTSDAQAEEKAEIEFIRGLPACVDIR